MVSSRIIHLYQTDGAGQRDFQETKKMVSKWLFGRDDLVDLQTSKALTRAEG